MGIIQLDVSEIISLKKRISQMSSKIEDCYSEVSKVANAIDMKVSKRKDIDADLQHIKAELKKQKDFLEQCANLIGEAINEFTNAEKINNLPDLSVSLENTGVGKTDDRTYVDINDVIIGAGLVSASETSDLFSISKGDLGSLNFSNHPEFSEYIESIWSDTKAVKKTSSFVKEMAGIIEGFGGKTPEQLNNIVGSDVFKAIGYISDVEKLVNVIVDRDVESYTDLLGKYGIEEPVKALVKLSGESSAGASLVADFAVQTIKSTAEVTSDKGIEIYSVLADPNSDWKDYLKCIESLSKMQNDIAIDTAWNVVGSKAQTMSEISDFVGLTEYGEHFEEFTGKTDATVIDFYETAASEVSAMHERVGFIGTIEYFAEGLSETVSEQFADLSNLCSKWVERGPIV